MTTLIKLGWRAFPYLLTGMAALWIFVGVGTLFSDVPTSPQIMTMEQLRSTARKNLPGWIEVKNAYPFWPAATTVVTQNTKTGETMRNNEVLVPLVDVELTKNWTNLASMSPRPTGYLVRMSWDSVRTKYPRVARLLEQQRPNELVSESAKPFPVSFETADARQKYDFGPAGAVVKEMLDLGFQEVIAVVPDSKPMQKSDAAAMTVIGVVTLIAGIFWIRRRRRKAKAPVNFQDELLAAANRGFTSGANDAIHGAVSEGVRRAMQRFRDEQAAAQK